ncbi:MAG: hypothetical protein KatS3mg020_0397 [Fimbriimonadales bacterium]|nr:MAG: hypothetical protein KatS3mg020_0397 [Fimbriimonadales bacterium]
MLLLTRRGKALAPIIIQKGATEPERYAAQELQAHLEQATGARFEVREADTLSPRAIVIGQGEWAERLRPDVNWRTLGGEETLISVQEGYLLLSGGRPRGTLYAVYRFLQTQLGMRWWTPWAQHIPRRRDLTIPSLNLREQPAFEYREPFWFHAFEGDWAARNYSNGHRPQLSAKHGGKIEYVGFVHTSFWLAPPQTYFAQHPDWYSLLDGKRQWEKAQLCWTNPSLREFLTERVRQILKENPQAQIISISQEDWTGACQCEPCRAVEEREGSAIAPILETVNLIAERLEREFPSVAFDTLAYWYTRKPTRRLRPRPNVIVRLCSIECSFAQPMESPANADFAADIRGWSERCQRLYVWDYTTNFTHYLSPHPNYFVLGANLRFFHKHGVRGVFEQGAYQSHGGEMAELKAWLLAQLLWNPYQDDARRLDEFLRGYYGAAARWVKRYLQLMASAAQEFRMGCFTNPAAAPYLRYSVLRQAETLWERAEQAVQADPDLRWRVQIARLPVWYAWLVNWEPLQAQASEAKQRWQPPAEKKTLAERWLQRATASGPIGWQPITHVNEAGLTPENFVKQILG